jgi:hypothetical protein
VAHDWTYGVEGKAFPVQPGEVWSVGDHLFVCSDLMESEQFDQVLKGVTPTILYSDPPWGQALLNGFRTKAGMEKASYSWNVLYREIAEIAIARGIPLWLEGSKPSSKDGAQIPETMGEYPHRWGWEITYANKLPCGLFYAGREPVPPQLRSALLGMHDDHTPGTVMQAYGASGLVIDTCGGRGLTSREAHRVGWVSILNEMNPYRVSSSLYRAEKAGMGSPGRVE